MAEKIEKKVKRGVPLYAAAAGFLLGALIFPVYSAAGILLSLALACAAYLLANRRWGTRTILVDAPATIYATGEADLDETLAKAQRDLAALDALNARIPDAQLSADIDRMEKAGKAILAEVAAHPEKAKRIRKFAAYYLPTSLKILTAYAELSASGAQGENAQGVMAQVKQNAGIIATAFETQLDALFADKVLDVSSDLTVLDGMVKGDGLTMADTIGQAAAANPAPASDVASQLARDIARGASPAAGSVRTPAGTGSTSGASGTDDDMKPHLTL